MKDPTLKFHFPTHLRICSHFVTSRTGVILSILDGKFVLLDPKAGTYKDFVVDGFKHDERDYNFEVYA